MASCKIVVAPHVATGPYATSRQTFAVSQRNWRKAVDHARTGDTTIFLVCDKGELRVAACHEAKCRLDADLGGDSPRVIAGRRRAKRRSK
jgi:hypothetical protein